MEVHTTQCRAITKRRGLNRRCLHMTQRGQYCHQHLETERGFKITETNTNPDDAYGLITTEAIPKGQMIAEYDGVTVTTNEQLHLQRQMKIKDHTYIVPESSTTKAEGQWAKPARASKANAEAVLQGDRAFLYATRDIEPMEEILCPPIVVNPDIKQAAVAASTKPRKKSKEELDKARQDRLDKKYETTAIKRLEAMRHFLTNEAFAKKRKLTRPANATVVIPEKGHDIVTYHKKLEKLITATEKRLVPYFRTGIPSTTLEQVRTALDGYLTQRR